MGDRDEKEKKVPEVVIRDRRSKRQGELSPADILRILRRRGKEGGDDAGGGEHGR